MAISTGDCKSWVAYLGQGNKELFEGSRSGLLERIKPNAFISIDRACYCFGRKGKSLRCVLFRRI